MLQAQPDKNNTTEQLLDEIASLLQKLDDYNVRIVKGFVERLVDHSERTNEMHGAS